MQLDEKAKDFLGAYFDPEMAGLEDRQRHTLWNVPGDYRERVQVGLADLLRTRSITVKEFYDITDTYLDVETEDEVYAEIAKAYEFLFDQPAPAFEGQKS